MSESERNAILDECFAYDAITVVKRFIRVIRTLRLTVGPPFAERLFDWAGDTDIWVIVMR